MRHFFKVLVATLTIGFSVFLIQRACRENGHKLDPNEKGGFAQARPIPTRSAIRTPSESKSLFLREQTSEIPALVPNSQTDTRVDNTVNMDRLGGDWVLADQDNTELELRIAGNTGTLYFFKAGKPIIVNQKVSIIAVADLALVTSQNEMLLGGDENGNKNTSRPDKYARIAILFEFRGDQVDKVSWGSGDWNQWGRLRVVSHTK